MPMFDEDTDVCVRFEDSPAFARDVLFVLSGDTAARQGGRYMPVSSVPVGDKCEVYWDRTHGWIEGTRVGPRKITIPVEVRTFVDDERTVEVLLKQLNRSDQEGDWWEAFDIVIAPKPQPKTPEPEPERASAWERLNDEP